jgi:hypothetical protein
MNITLERIPEIAKAIAGGLTTGAAAMSQALPNGVDTAEWLTIAVAFLVGSGVVYAVPNRAPAEPVASRHEPEAEVY